MEEGELFQGKYKLGDKLGEGGMGVVYAAEQVPSGLHVAIKFVSGRKLQGERLLREAKMLAKLSHNNVVRLYDFDRTKSGDYYIVMELVEGDTLHKLIRHARKHGKLLEPQHAQYMLTIMAQVADGMEAAHKAGIVHRDLKPENVIISKGGVARVVDFGLAKNPNVAALPPSAPATNPANVVGTPQYMAPEQIRGKEVDARTDIYAIGICLYEALTGCGPFESEGEEPRITELMGRHCFAEPTPLRDHVPGCSERISALVLRCLAKDPAARFQTARELALAIRSVLTEELAEEQARVQARVKREATARAARETEPQPAEWTSGPVLPFVSPMNHVPQRITAPMSPTTTHPAPTFAATTPIAAAPPVAQRGVGFTTKMARPSATVLAAAEAEERGAAPASAVAVEEAREPNQPGPVSTSGVHLKHQHQVPTPSSFETAPTWPEGRAHGADQSPRRARVGLPPLVVAPMMGAALALLVLVMIALLRSPATSAPSSQPQPSSSMTAAASVAPPPTTSAPSSQPPPTTSAPSSQPPPTTSAPSSQPSPPTTSAQPIAPPPQIRRKSAGGAQQGQEQPSKRERSRALFGVEP